MENMGENGNKNHERQGLKTRFKLFFKGEFFQNKIVLWLVVLSLFLNLADWAMLAIFIKPIDSPIILHYNVYFGVDMAGSWKMVFILPSIGLTLFLVNFFLAKYFYSKLERIACHILLIAGFMIQLSLIIASLSVILINY